MAPRRERKENARKRTKNLPNVSHMPTTSREHDDDEESGRKNCFKYIYNKETKMFLGRTWKSWLLIISYSIIYLLFLCTYTLIFLFATLIAFKYTEFSLEKPSLLTYSENGVGLSEVPSEYSYPMIWYKMGEEKDYEKYISAIDRLLVSRRGKEIDYTDLGPCSKAPYGYGSSPCVIIRINHQLKWAGKALKKNSTSVADVPEQVREWMRSDEKLWLHCDGQHSYDKEHIGKINYFPYPPGFDPKAFPLDVRNQSPLVALQISGFTEGVSLIVKCNLWYEDGPSALQFMLYVEPKTNSNSSDLTAV